MKNCMSCQKFRNMGFEPVTIKRPRRAITVRSSGDKDQRSCFGEIVVVEPTFMTYESIMGEESLDGQGKARESVMTMPDHEDVVG